MQDHTLRGLICESALEPETYESISSYFIDATLSHPLNQRVVREFEIDNPGSEVPPDSRGRMRASRNYTELVDSLGERLGRPPIGVSNYLVGFPQVTFYGRYKNAVVSRLCERLLLSHGLDVISRKPDKIDATLPCGSIWLPVLSHPRGNETEIDWTGGAHRPALEFELRVALSRLRNESKDAPLCKSLERYSVGYQTSITLYDRSVMISNYGLLYVFGSALERVEVNFLCLIIRLRDCYLRASMGKL